jgi:hypothetical protein
VEANSTGGQGSRRAVAPSNDDADDDQYTHKLKLFGASLFSQIIYLLYSVQRQFGPNFSNSEHECIIYL